MRRLISLFQVGWSSISFQMCNVGEIHLAAVTAEFGQLVSFHDQDLDISRYV